MSQRDISSRTCEISQAVEAGQLAMFRLADRDHGLGLRIIGLDAGIPYGTLRSYAQGTAMPVSALLKLAKVIPAHLINLMLDPGGKVLADAEPDETDLDDAVIAALEMTLKWARARHPNSSSGVAIDHTERPDIELAAAAVTGAVAKIAS